LDWLLLLAGFERFNFTFDLIGGLDGPNLNSVLVELYLGRVIELFDFDSSGDDELLTITTCGIDNSGDLYPE
jgi:hypothetical protein